MKIGLYPNISNEHTLPFHVTSVGECGNQEHWKRTEGYPEYHWLHCVNGKGKLFLGDNEYIISENMGFFFYPGVPHEYFPVSEPWETHWLTFKGHALPGPLELIGLEQSKVFHLNEVGRLEKILNDIYITIQVAAPDAALHASAQLYLFLAQLSKSLIVTNVDHTLSKHKILQPVISYMEKHFQTNPTLEEMSAIINVTPQHLCRLFKQVYNTRPFVHLTKLRLNKAKELLKMKNSPSISDISSMVGYNDTSYFCATFKEYEGITPLEYKRINTIEKMLPLAHTLTI